MVVHKTHSTNDWLCAQLITLNIGKSQSAKNKLRIHVVQPAVVRILLANTTLSTRPPPPPDHLSGDHHHHHQLQQQANTLPGHNTTNTKTFFFLSLSRRFHFVLDRVICGPSNIYISCRVYYLCLPNSNSISLLNLPMQTTLLYVHTNHNIILHVIYTNEQP